MRSAATRLLVWSLSPVGTLVNAASLVAVLLLAGVPWDRPMLWMIVAIFVASAAYLDTRAYIARRRLGLSANEAGEVLMDRIWGPRTEKERE